VDCAALRAAFLLNRRSNTPACVVMPEAMRAILKRIAAGSPLLPALIYTAAAWLANTTATLAPTSELLVALTALIWLAVGLLFFIVVVWFRDDDWLAAGFLLGVTLLLSGWSANVLAESITNRSLVPVLFAAPGMLLGVVIRGIISVPVLGGLVALLRWLTGLIRPVRRPPASAPRA